MTFLGEACYHDDVNHQKKPQHEKSHKMHSVRPKNNQTYHTLMLHYTIVLSCRHITQTFNRSQVLRFSWVLSISLYVLWLFRSHLWVSLSKELGFRVHELRSQTGVGQSQTRSDTHTHILCLSSTVSLSLSLFLMVYEGLIFTIEPNCIFKSLFYLNINVFSNSCYTYFHLPT